MKTPSIAFAPKGYPIGKTELGLVDENEENFLNFHQFTVPTPMTEQEIAPPLHVWNKIVNILDEQDRQKALLNNNGSLTFPVKNKLPRKYVYASLTATIAVAIIWLLF